MEKKLQCNICNFEFKIDKKQKYQVKSESIMLRPVGTYDAIDCPNCGSQILIKIRLPKLTTTIKENK